MYSPQPPAATSSTAATETAKIDVLNNHGPALPEDVLIRAEEALLPNPDPKPNGASHSPPSPRKLANAHPRLEFSPPPCTESGGEYHDGRARYHEKRQSSRQSLEGIYKEAVQPTQKLAH